MTAEHGPWRALEPVRGLGRKADRVEIGKIRADPVEGDFAIEPQVRLHKIACNTANALLSRNVEIQIDLAVVGLPIERQVAEIDLRLGPDRIVVLQPQSRGAGLGLNLARQIAGLHDGTIRILDGSWRRARVRMELPVRK
ncbi:hypothetical protein ACWGTO_19885 [Mesorhizobium sp. PL10]